MSPAAQSEISKTPVNDVSAIPHIPSMPLFGWRGNLLRLATDPLNFIHTASQLGSVVRLAARENPTLMVHAPADATHTGTILAFGAENNHHILSNPDIFHSGAILGTLAPRQAKNERQAVLTRLGTGLFGINDAAHRRERRLLQPAFHRRYIEGYRDEMVAQTAALLGRWQAGQTRNIHADMMQLTLLIAGHTLFGLDFTRGGAKLGEEMQAWLRLISHPAVLLCPYDLPLTPYRRLVNLSLSLDQQMRAVIAQKRQQNLAAATDVLSTLIQVRDEEGEQLSEAELIGHANMLFVAGHETSSNALTWTLFLLAQHPDIMAAVYEELTAVLSGDAPAVAQLSELQLLDRVIKESLRILPPVPASGRLVAQDTELAGYAIPRGYEVIFSHYHTHHNPQVYAEPERFDPDRWLTISPSPHEYMPFSAGRRMCLGSEFARMELKIVLAMILQKYRLQLQPNAKIDPLVGITMGPQAGLPMIVHPQDCQFAANKTAVRGKILACVHF